MNLTKNPQEIKVITDAITNDHYIRKGNAIHNQIPMNDRDLINSSYSKINKNKFNIINLKYSDGVAEGDQLTDSQIIKSIISTSSVLSEKDEVELFQFMERFNRYSEDDCLVLSYILKYITGPDLQNLVFTLNSDSYSTGDYNVKQLIELLNKRQIDMLKELFAEKSIVQLDIYHEFFNAPSNVFERGRIIISDEFHREFINVLMFFQSHNLAKFYPDRKTHAFHSTDQPERVESASSIPAATIPKTSPKQSHFTYFLPKPSREQSMTPIRDTEAEIPAIKSETKVLHEAEEKLDVFIREKSVPKLLESVEKTPRHISTERKLFVPMERKIEPPVEKEVPKSIKPRTKKFLKAKKIERNEDYTYVPQEIFEESKKSQEKVLHEDTEENILISEESTDSSSNPLDICIREIEYTLNEKGRNSVKDLLFINDEYIIPPECQKPKRGNTSITPVQLDVNGIVNELRNEYKRKELIDSFLSYKNKWIVTKYSDNQIEKINHLITNICKELLLKEEYKTELLEKITRIDSSKLTKLIKEYYNVNDE